MSYGPERRPQQPHCREGDTPGKSWAVAVAECHGSDGLLYHWSGTCSWSMLLWGYMHPLHWAVTRLHMHSSLSQAQGLDPATISYSGSRNLELANIACCSGYMACQPRVPAFSCINCSQLQIKDQGYHFSFSPLFAVARQCWKLLRLLLEVAIRSLSMSFTSSFASRFSLSLETTSLIPTTFINKTANYLLEYAREVHVGTPLILVSIKF